MRCNNWFIMALCFLFLLKGTGVYAMVHCQGQQQHINPTLSVSNSAADLTSHARHQHAAKNSLDSTAASHAHESAANAEPCEACDHCCSIHCAPLPALFTVAQAHYHDKALQFAYFPTAGVVIPQERPPKSA
jgi:hypothetical protein